MAETVLKLNRVSKIFGPFDAVNRINLEVKRGDVVALLGPNGAGKTTTIKLIAGLIRPTFGEILIKNENGEFQNIHKKSTNLVKIGFLIDIPSFYRGVSANQILKFLGRAQRIPKNKLIPRIDKLLKIFNLYKWRDEKVQYFSKGMTQKLGIISAMLADPEILIFDEPQTGIDPKARVEVRNIITSLKKMGKTIIICSHMIHEMSQLCNKIAFINRGKLIAFDTIENMQKGLKINEITCQFLNPINIGIEKLLRRIIEDLKPYLDTEIKRPVDYIPEMDVIKIYFDGKKESRARMLEILASNYKSDFTLISYSQPRTNLLEQIYDKTIV